MYSYLCWEDKPAFKPAMIPWAAAYSYPVVPLICPAKYKLFKIVDYNVYFSRLGSTKSYYIAYPGLIIYTFSNPLIDLNNKSWISAGNPLFSPFGYTTLDFSPSGYKKILWEVFSGNLMTFFSIAGQYLGPFPLP